MSTDLAIIVSDPSVAERAADPAEFIIQACERAKTWLHEALEHGDIGQIAELKSQAEAIRVYTMQKQLGKDAELSAAEIVRRAERGIGVVIRRGQAEGSVRGRNGGDRRSADFRFKQEESEIPNAYDFVTRGELYGGGNGKAGIYQITDGISDAEFEDALAAAREERDLSRTNVMRKARSRTTSPAPDEWIPEPGANRTTDATQRRKLMRQWAEEGYSSRQMAEILGMSDEVVRRIARECGIEIRADSIIGRTKRHDSSRIVEETTHILEGAAMSLQLVSPADLDPAQVQDWVASLTDSIRAINRVIKAMKEAIQ